MGCCNSCDNGGPCDCGGNCNGSCGKSPILSDYSEGEAYEAVMGGPITDNIRNNTKLWKKGEKLYIRFHNPEWNGTIVVSVPFAPLIMFCQNLAMLYGRPETRSPTVSGYAPIIALVASQLAAKKIQEDTDKKEGKDSAKTPAKSPADFGPIDLTSLLKLMPISMVGVAYDDSDSIGAGMPRRSMRKVYRAPFDPCTRDPNSVACRLSQKFASRQSLSGEEEKEIIMGACGCGVPCDGIQPDSPYMSPRRVVKRASAWTPFYTKRVNSFWRNAPLVNDQASNHFGRAKSAPPSAAPPDGWPNRPVEPINMKLPPQEQAEVSGWRMDGMPYGNGSYYNPDMGLDCNSSIRNTPACRRAHMHGEDDIQVPCAAGGTCGKGCCA